MEKEQPVSRLIELERNQLKQEVQYQRKLIRWLVLIIISLLLLFTMSSCSKAIPTKGVIISPYIVTNINEWREESVWCQYILSTKNSYLHYENEIALIDSAGKFSVGDTIAVTLVKY